MNLDKLNQTAVQHANQQSSMIVLSDDQLKQVTGGTAAAEAGSCRRCKYKYSSSVVVAK